MNKLTNRNKIFLKQGKGVSKVRKAILATIIAVLMLGFGLPAYAESDFAIGGSASVDLNFRVQIPTMLYLRIGSVGATVDEVVFDVTQPPEEEAWVDGDAPVEVRVGALIASAAGLTLAADSSTDLVGASTAGAMPFTVIRASGTSDFSSISNLAFTSAADQSIWTGTGSGLRSGQMSFQYENTYDYEPDDYTGTVTYTLSSP